MSYTADYLIQFRKEMWNKYKSLTKDADLREGIASEIMKDAELLAEIRQNPEKLIEMMFVIVDKDKKTNPFFLNDVQLDFVKVLKKAIEDYKAGRINDISILVLKGRQQGFTSFITAYQLACTITNMNFEGYTIADIAENAESIFENKAKFPHSQLPKVLKPTEKFNNKRQLRFDKLNSSWGVDTATKNMGRSKTINFLHASECAFWTCGIAITQASLGEALTKSAIKIYESTANGFNDYRDMWVSGKYINCFYAWWRTQEYRLNFESPSKKKEFEKNIVNNTSWIWERIRWLKNNKKLDAEQLYWYFCKYEKYIDKDLIKQEYPCTPEEAFIASGQCVFDKDNLIKRIDEVEEPIKTGLFLYDYDGLEITKIRWQDDPNGPIRIYKEVEVGKPYVIGGDTAGEGSDNFTGHVLDNITGEQIAVLENKFDEDIYARQMYCLGIYYNTALIAIESNFSTFPNQELQRLHYPKLFVRQTMDTYTHKYKDSFGFKTTSATRPVLIAVLTEIIRETPELIRDKETLKECLTFVKNEKGRPEAMLGCHDDHVIGLGIAHIARSQQKMTMSITDKSGHKEKWSEDLLNDYYNADEKTRKIIIEKYGEPVF